MQENLKKNLNTSTTKAALKYEAWPSMHELLDKVKENKVNEDEENVDANNPRTTNAFELIYRKPYPEKIRKYSDVFASEKTVENHMKSHITSTANCYEVRPILNLENCEVIFKKNYFLPGIFKRFYKIQIERFTKSVQQEFDEMVKQNQFFIDRVDLAYEDFRNDLHEFPDAQSVKWIKACRETHTRFSSRIQSEMEAKFNEKIAVIKKYGTKEFDDIFEYRVNLYVCNTEALDMETRKYPQLFGDFNELDP